MTAALAPAQSHRNSCATAAQPEPPMFQASIVVAMRSGLIVAEDEFSVDQAVRLFAQRRVALTVDRREGDKVIVRPTWVSHDHRNGIGQPVRVPITLPKKQMNCWPTDLVAKIHIKMGSTSNMAAQTT
jgi:hypothetical protein